MVFEFDSVDNSDTDADADSGADSDHVDSDYADSDYADSGSDDADSDVIVGLSLSITSSSFLLVSARAALSSNWFSTCKCKC